MKKIVCLFSCLFGFNLSAMGDDVPSTKTLFIICIARQASTESLSSLQDCPVPTPTKKNGICPVKSPQPKACCPVISPKPIKTGNENSLEEDNYLLLAVYTNSRK